MNKADRRIEGANKSSGAAYVCMHACMYVCMYVCRYSYMYMYMYNSLNAQTWDE